jgi:hypothetical protein
MVRYLIISFRLFVCITIKTLVNNMLTTFGLSKPNVSKVFDQRSRIYIEKYVSVLNELKTRNTLTITNYYQI